MSNATKHITLSALTEKIRLAVESGTGGEQWVVAEVSSLQVNYSGHCYLELTERTEGQQMPKAVCKAVIWANRFKMIAAYFRHQTGGDISVGMKILVSCSASFHSVYGLSLVISDIDPTYTIGEVGRVKQQSVARLQQDGVFGMNKELPLPMVVQRVAVVSSATAAGYGDFCNELQASAYNFELTLFQAIMQGEGAERSIIAALEEVAEYEFDAVVIIRGGGSVSDLACFDNYNLCANIAQFPMPIITGIGHERDSSVADMVAAVSLKTPTAVASFMIELAAAFTNRLERAEVYIKQKTVQIVTGESRRVENISLHLQSLVKRSIHNNQIKIHSVESTLGFTARRAIEQRLNMCEALYRSLGERSLQRIAEQVVSVGRLTERLKESVHGVIVGESHRLEMVTLGVEALDPRRILKRGYAIINNGLHSVNQISQGDELTVELSDGVIKAKVNEKWQKKS